MTYTTPIFFNPDDTFTDWLGQLARDRIILDIGFGSGNTMKRLSERGFTKLIGIDPYADIMSVRMDWMQTMETNVPHTLAEEIGEGIHMKMMEMGGDKLVAFLCRPCHHDSLIRTSYDVCKKYGVDLYYIGLKSNLGRDLWWMQDDIERVQHEGSSDDGEIVLKLT